MTEEMARLRMEIDLLRKLEERKYLAQRRVDKPLWRLVRGPDGTVVVLDLLGDCSPPSNQVYMSADDPAIADALAVLEKAARAHVAQQIADAEDRLKRFRAGELVAVPEKDGNPARLVERATA